MDNDNNRTDCQKETALDNDNNKTDCQKETAMDNVTVITRLTDTVEGDSLGQL